MPLSPKAALAKDKATAGARLQHRHFATIAAIISYLNPDIREDVAVHFAHHLRHTNERFDMERFLRASGLDTVEYEKILRDQESLAG